MKTGELYRDKEGRVLLAHGKDESNLFYVDPNEIAWLFRYVCPSRPPLMWTSRPSSQWEDLTEISVHDLSVEELLYAAEEPGIRKLFEKKVSFSDGRVIIDLCGMNFDMGKR